MIIKEKMCYIRLLEMIKQPEFVRAVVETSFKRPDIDNEGFNGYVETEVTFHVADLKEFTNAYYSTIMTAETYQLARAGLRPT